MKNMKQILPLLAICTLSLSTWATGGSTSVGPANPAALNCIRLGGVIETVVTEAGTDANCAIDEWQLFREMDRRGLVKEHHYNHEGGIASMPNPAAVNCNDINGSIRIEEDSAGQRGICVVGQWDLFRAINVSNEQP